MLRIDMNLDPVGIPSTFDPDYDLVPAEIYAMLEEEVVGQESAKRALSVAVYNHVKRIQYQGPVRLEKSNVLLVGPTGCGKTLLARTLARILGVPFVVGSATSLTEAGYVGEDVEALLTRLLQKADQDVELAQRGVLFIDEMDKLIARNPMEGVSTIGVQADLLKLLEGSLVEVPRVGVMKGVRSECVTLDTSQILFICAGAFRGLTDTISRRLKPRQHLGLAKGKVDEAALLGKVTPTDLIEHGLLAELVGRLPVIVPLAPLVESNLKRILGDMPSGIVQQYRELFRMDGVELVIEEEALEAIARFAQEEGGGARSLRRVMEMVMSDRMFDLPSMAQAGSIPGSTVCRVTAQDVETVLQGRPRAKALRGRVLDLRAHAAETDRIL